MTRRKPHTFRQPAKQGRRMWRSLEDKADPKRLQAKAAAEQDGGFVQSMLGSGTLLKKTQPKREDPLAKQPRLSRRGFLQSSSAATAALALQGCVRRPVENILPYVQGPEYSIPGIPTHFATVTARGNDALGLLVTSHQGRPTKIEGNADHPSSRGATDLRAQAYLWDLYDPDRSQSPAKDGEDATWEDLDAALRELTRAHADDGGAGLRILAQPTNSPSFQRLRAQLLARFPQASFHTYASINSDNVRAGAELAFGQPLMPVWDLQRAEVVLALDSDFLGNDEGSVRNARAFGRRRQISNPDTDRMNRLYAVEGTFSITGAAADHRLRVPASQVGKVLRAIAAKLQGQVELGAAGSGGELPAGVDEAWIDALVADLVGNRQRAAVLVGPRQPAHVHALAFAINHALGAVGGTLEMYPPTDPEQPASVESLGELMNGIDRTRTLVILGGNPVYDTPGDVDFTEVLGRDGLTSIHLSSHRDETSQLCTWHIPLAHELETWGDQRSADGTIALQQPLIAPLWGARSEIEILGILAGERNWRGHYVVRRTMRQRIANPVSFEREWRRSLHRGLVAGSATRPVRIPANLDAVGGALSAAEEPEAPTESSLEVQFVPDPALWDGRHANNLWCLECPDPMTKISWDNAALMSRTTRDALSLENGDVIELSRDGSTIEVAVWGLPGHADNSVTLILGWGRSAAGRYGNAQTWSGIGPEPDWQAGGFDVQPLRRSDGFYFATGVSLSDSGRDYDLVPTQEHGYMEGRAIAIDATLEEYRAEPEFASYRSVELTHGPLWERVDYSRQEVATGRFLHRWGMAIDLSACTGCNACVVACQAENNIPAVGKQEVKRGREMLWMRIDRYFVGESDHDPQISLQPVLCQQCEEAPCENVCPVNATIHSPEGLNDMAYNRCIGTRYCANNCPYKVRRFNYLDWHNHLDAPWQMHGEFPETRKMVFNPNVTVRMRGVMEKCTFCVQRIQEAKFRSRREHRDLVDGDIVTACEAVCPSGAIVFGDLNEEQSRVSVANAMNRRYLLLAEVGTQPRITYLARIRNPNPAIEPPADAHGHDEHEDHGDEHADHEEG